MTATLRAILLIVAVLAAFACEGFYSMERSAHVYVGPPPCNMVAEKGWSGMFVQHCMASATPTSTPAQTGTPIAKP